MPPAVFGTRRIWRVLTGLAGRSMPYLELLAHWHRLTRGQPADLAGCGSFTAASVRALRGYRAVA
jgi:hypothetical protein